LIRSGAATAAAQQVVWGELKELIELRARVSSAEHKRLMDHQGVMNIAEVALIVRTFLAAAREVISSKEELRLVTERTLKLLPRD
jgi:hypothetical protein